jgi:hypothetical protein
VSEPADIDLVAAALRADTGDLRVYIEVLAHKLEEAFPGLCRVRRAGILGKGAVKTIAVDLGEHRYELEHRNGSVTARHSSVVRGIALKNEELGLDEWIRSIAAGVTSEAARSERGRLALENLLTGHPSEETS